LYAVADIFITKPGGLSVAEGLSFRLPILITHWLPGQEQLNIQYLAKQRLIMASPYHHMNLAWTIRTAIDELLTGNFRNSLAQNPNLSQIIDVDSAGQKIKLTIQSLLSNIKL